MRLGARQSPPPASSDVTDGFPRAESQTDAPMAKTSDLMLRFWGVRGSIACPASCNMRYGGNTSCIEIRRGDDLIIIDGGTGLRDLGHRLMEEGRPNVDVFFTHTHWDHVCGVPFFKPAYAKGRKVRFWAGHLKPQNKSIYTVLCETMMAPLFPVPIGVFQDCEYHDFDCGTPMEPFPGITLNTCWLNHPNLACGYRIDVGGKSICIITDTEHRPEGVDQVIADFVRGADIMVYDAMFTDEEYPRFVGWGHSTWQEALKLADAADVGRVVLFHHDPNHDDAFLDRIADAADRRRPGTLVAHEGMTLHP